VFIPLRVWLWAAIVRPLKHVIPLPALVGLARPRTRRAGGPARSEPVERRLGAYLMRRGRFPARPPGNCLERSLAAYRLLCSAGAEARLVVGVRPSEGGVEGHVWVVLNGRPFAESAPVTSYAAVVAFDAAGNREEGPGERADLSGVRWA
jgi:Transglutaminase-like superfamily